VSTTFEEVYDLFTIVVQDYKLTELYNYSVEHTSDDFTTYLQGFLIRAIPRFTYCANSLSYTTTPTAQFTATLTLNEKEILSDLMVVEWFDREINDVTQFNLHLNDTDFKHYAEGQNLKEKSDRIDRLREKIKQDMTDYEFGNIDWNAWASGDFSGS
jgi:hypothetical protein